jgi:metal-sulfur cluster biosynthetic enzyme
VAQFTTILVNKQSTALIGYLCIAKNFFNNSLSMEQQDILNALQHVEEPDLKKDLVTLGMVKDIQIEGKNVSFTIVLTTPACPLKEKIHRDCEQAILEHADPNAIVNVKFTANTSSNRVDGKALLSNVKKYHCRCFRKRWSGEVDRRCQPCPGA